MQKIFFCFCFALSFATANAQSTVVMADTIGIGTTVPQALLHVQGTVLVGTPTSNNPVNSNYMLDVKGFVRANQVTVNTTGADFVFSPLYKLRPLKEVEDYINTYHHLPEIAPASEMEKDGLNIGENQTKLLQKVEELTLYMIELEKQNKLLQKEIEALKKENSKRESKRNTKASK
ncbi:MAG: hypothetical protein LBE82_09845 [Chitinophagaceae bacterium]|jgi:uncharacterized small protein (DUF1192 family)|nr:hypothetical protein [Chitinophagaceae bacterium]